MTPVWAALFFVPLSAAHLELTVPEQRGWVDRTKLLNISGIVQKAAQLSAGCRPAALRITPALRVAAF